MYDLLIVDDKDAFRRKITRMSYFKSCHSKFRIKGLAGNGLEALDLLNAGGFDIVLTDIRMPLMNGIELLKAINKKELCRCVILLSEFADFYYAKEGIINGAFDYIVKPVDDDKLKVVFDRAYHHIQNLAAENNSLLNSIVKLRNCIVSEDDAPFFAALNLVIKHLKLKSNSKEEVSLIINNILDEIKHHIEINIACADLYLPLNKICALNTAIQDAGGLIELFSTKITLLHRELAKFRSVASESFIDEICNYIILNVDGKCSLKSIADKFYINKKYLSALFKRKTGIRYVDFVTYFKIERAKMLLSDPNLRIYNVAAMLGFSNAEYFSKVFKRQTGSNPRSFAWGLDSVCEKPISLRGAGR